MTLQFYLNGILSCHCSGIFQNNCFAEVSKTCFQQSDFPPEKHKGRHTIMTENLAPRKIHTDKCFNIS